MMTKSKYQGNLNDCKTAIMAKFKDECTKRKDKISLNASDLEFTTSGQFFSITQQTGLHGISAALSVLSTSENDNQAEKLCSQLCTYLENREAIDNDKLQKGTHEHIDIAKKQVEDQNNTIKIAELLFSSKRLPDSDKQKIKNYSKALFSQKNLSYWGYDLSITPKDEKDASDIATAYVLLALDDLNEKSHDSVYATALANVNKKYKLLKGQNNAGNDAISDIFVLYLLSLNSRSDKNFAIFKEITQLIYSKLSTLMADRGEYNHEYFYRGKNRYLRIPWQFYLVELCAKFNPAMLSNKKIFAFTNSAMNAINEDKPYYSSSNSKCSTRTYAITYQSLVSVSLKLIQNNFFENIMFYPYYLLSLIRSLLNNKTFMFIVAFAAVVSTVFFAFYYGSRSGLTNSVIIQICWGGLGYLLYCLKDGNY